MTRPHVIIINDHAFINGGQAKVAIDTALGLAERGYEVTFFAACGPADERLPSARVRVVCLDQADLASEPDRLRGMARGLWNGRAASVLSEELVRHDPRRTVIHWHGYAKALSPSIAPVIFGSGIPHLFTMHEYFLACPNGGFFDYQENSICTRRALGPACLMANCDARHPAHKAWRLLRQAVTHGPAHLPSGLTDVIYISETQRRVMASYFGEHVRLHHVPNPVSIQSGPRVTAENNDAYLFIGRLSREKGAALFAEAARTAGVRAIFLGDGPEIDHIKAVNPDAECRGWAGPREVEAALSEARCLVFPSLWYECQPLVPQEAAAKGVPTICGAWSAAAEAVEHAVTGLLMTDASIDEMASAIAVVEREAQALSEAAYSRFWKQYSPETYFINIEILYDYKIRGRAR
ncbi:MAG: glycosyltransferase family 4 protein [Oceanicaulis sp.]